MSDELPMAINPLDGRVIQIACVYAHSGPASCKQCVFEHNCTDKVMDLLPVSCQEFDDNEARIFLDGSTKYGVWKEIKDEQQSDN